MTTGGYIMNRAASLLNDNNRTIFNYTNLLPYLNTAIQELREEMELSNVPFTNATDSIIMLDAEVDNIGNGGPPLPVGLIEIQQIWQRGQSSGNVWLPITKYEFLPHNWQNDNQTTSYIPAWAWMEQVIKFIPANIDLDIKIDYIKNNMPDVVNEDSQITLINCENILAFRTAGLAARYIGENPTRAEELNDSGQMALDRFLGINAKGRQAIRTRRRPLNASYKAQQNGW